MILQTDCSIALHFDSALDIEKHYVSYLLNSITSKKDKISWSVDLISIIDLARFAFE